MAAIDARLLLDWHQLRRPYSVVLHSIYTVSLSRRKRVTIESVHDTLNVGVPRLHSQHGVTVYSLRQSGRSRFALLRLALHQVSLRWARLGILQKVVSIARTYDRHWIIMNLRIVSMPSSFATLRFLNGFTKPEPMRSSVFVLNLHSNIIQKNSFRRLYSISRTGQKIKFRFWFPV